MTYTWVIPVVLIILILVIAFWFVIKHKGGSGHKTSGRTVLDKPSDDPHPGS